MASAHRINNTSRNVNVMGFTVMELLNCVETGSCHSVSFQTQFTHSRDFKEAEYVLPEPRGNASQNERIVRDRSAFRHTGPPLTGPLNNSEDGPWKELDKAGDDVSGPWVFIWAICWHSPLSHEMWCPCWDMRCQWRFKYAHESSHNSKRVFQSFVQNVVGCLTLQNGP
jgi:hypothetical protein